MQIYRGFDRGTAKPTVEERAAVPHCLIDIANPRRNFSTGDYVRAADRALAECRQRQTRPFLVGGTGLYVRCLLRGMFDGPRRQPELRRRLERIRNRRGLVFLHRMLRRVDPATARRVGAGDAQRVVRALEVRFASGRSLSDHLASQEGGGWSGGERYPCVKIGLLCERDRLRERIRSRVERFFASGLVEEVRDLLASGVQMSANAFKGIGYRQALDVVEGRCSEREAIEATFQATTRYAKRQVTWFRRERNVHWLQVGPAPERTLAAAESLIA